jgi:hypothetical protein
MLQAAEEQGMTPTNPRNLAPPKGHAFRNNERLLVHDPAFAEELFEYMRPVLETIVRVEDHAVPCGLSPDFRFYRYVKGEKVGGWRAMREGASFLWVVTGMEEEGGCGFCLLPPQKNMPFGIVRPNTGSLF